MELFMCNRSYFTDTIFHSEFHRHGVRSSDITHDRTLSREVKFLVKVMRTRDNVTEEMTLESPHHFYKEFSCRAGLSPFSTRRICSRDAKRKQEFSNVIGWRKSSLLRQPITFSTCGFLLLMDVKE